MYITVAAICYNVFTPKRGRCLYQQFKYALTQHTLTWSQAAGFTSTVTQSTCNSINVTFRPVWHVWPPNASSCQILWLCRHNECQDAPPDVSRATAATWKQIAMYSSHRCYNKLITLCQHWLGVSFPHASNTFMDYTPVWWKISIDKLALPRWLTCAETNSLFCINNPASVL